MLLLLATHFDKKGSFGRVVHELKPKIGFCSDEIQSEELEEAAADEKEYFCVLSEGEKLGHWLSFPSLTVPVWLQQQQLIGLA